MKLWPPWLVVSQIRIIALISVEKPLCYALEGKARTCLASIVAAKASVLQLLRRLVWERRLFTFYPPKTCLSHALSLAQASHLKLPPNTKCCAVSSIQ